MKRKKIEFIIVLLSYIIGVSMGVLGASCYYLSHEKDFYPVICDYTLKNVSGGTISIKFLLDKTKDFNEVSEFCRSKGFDRGIASSSTMIFCDSDEGRYKYFSVMKDFTKYIYKKYAK